MLFSLHQSPPKAYLSSSHTLVPGSGDITLYGPFYVTAAYFHDGPPLTADESPLPGQRRNGERTAQGQKTTSLNLSAIMHKILIHIYVIASRMYLNVSYFPFLVQFMAANTAMQGAYIPQYTHMQTTSVPVEVSRWI